MINTNRLFHTNFILIKTKDFWLRLNILIFDTRSLIRPEIVLNSIRDPTHILHRFWGNLGCSIIPTYSINKANSKSYRKMFSRNNSI